MDILSSIEGRIKQELDNAPGLYKPKDRQQLGLGTPLIRIIGKEYSKQVTDITLGRELFQQLMALEWYEYSIIGITVYKKFLKSFSSTDKNIMLNTLHNHVHDWAITDVFGLELLGPYIKQHNKQQIIKPLLQHNHIWTRRCANVAMVHLVRKGLYLQEAQNMVKEADATEDIMVKKSIAWLRRELAKTQ